jgi:hypothetical protein
MHIAAGHCVLIIGGRRLENLSCAVEVMDGSGPTSYGFLSGPVELLELARRARQVQIELDQGDILDAAILQINQSGLALITVSRSRP